MVKFDDEYFMLEALKEARNAFGEDEIPIGALIVAGEKIIARGHNQVEKLNDPTAHAEILAITSAAQFFNSKYLADCTLYVTVEPCPMCAGAIAWAQIRRIVYGTTDQKKGYTVFSEKIIPHKIKTAKGILEHDCSTLMKEFFRNKR